METVVRVFDENAAGVRIEALTLRLLGERISVAELIRHRVEAEVALHNASADNSGASWVDLVTPSTTERTLNGIRTRRRKRVDAEQQVRIAFEAFKRNGFFVLFQDRQVGSLEDEVLLTGEDTVSFLRLMPLVGG